MKTIIRSVAMLALMLAGIGTSDQLTHKTQAAGPSITGIGGYNQGDGVSNGRWTGQPSTAPTTASNAYKNFLAVDTWDWSSAGSSSYWDISGTGFGATQGTQGSVWFDPGYAGPLNFSITSIMSWSNTSIRVKVAGHWSFTYATNIKVVVRTANGATTNRTEKLVAVPKGRGYGQCTWEVFYQRKAAGLDPPDSAYSTTGSIVASYVPKQWDVLYYNSSHTGIIASAPTKTVAGSKTTYSFTVIERNAGWDEAFSSKAAQFSVQNGSVVLGIVLKTGKTANAYWRKPL